MRSTGGPAPAGNPARRSTEAWSPAPATRYRAYQRHHLLLHRGRGQPGGASGREVGRGLGHPGGGRRRGLRVGDPACLGVIVRRDPGDGGRAAPGSPSAGTALAAGTPGAPTGLTATPGNAEVGLSWTAPVAAGGSPARYRVYEGTSPGFTLGTPVMSTTSTNATVTGLTNGTTYYFVVAAVNAGGTVSAASAEASAEPLATAVLASDTKKVSRPVIISLAALVIAAVAGALALAARQLRKRLRKRPRAALGSDVRAVPEMGPPSPVNLHGIAPVMRAPPMRSPCRRRTWYASSPSRPPSSRPSRRSAHDDSGPDDDVITAADLLFGSPDDAQKALARHVMSAGRTTARAFERLPRVTREAAVREAAVAAVGLLKLDLMEVLVTGWREHRDIFSAARRTLDMPGSKELVGLAPHRVTTVQQPAVSILVDGRRVHTLQLGLSIFFEVTGLVAGICAGRLAAIHAGRGDLGLALTVHELEVLTKRIAPRAARSQVPPARLQAAAGQRVPGRVPRPPGRPAPRPASTPTASPRPVPGSCRAAAGCRDGGRPLPGRRPHGRPRPGHQPQRGRPRSAGRRRARPPGRPAGR